MAKKGFGKLVVFAAAAGAAAAGISYLKKYKSFNDELEEEFHDFEGNEEDDDDLFEEEETVTIAEEDAETEETKEPEAEDESAKEPESAEAKEDTADPRASRKYIPLNVSKDELKLAAKDMVSAAGEIAGAAKSVLKDAAVILSDTAYEAAVAAKDTAQIARAKLSERAELHRSRLHEEAAASDTAKDADSSEESSRPSPEAPQAAPTAHPAADQSLSPEDEQEKARNETAAAQFVPNAPAGAAGLETETGDSVLEVVKPEEAQKAVLDTEATTTIEDLEIEELDD